MPFESESYPHDLPLPQSANSTKGEAMKNQYDFSKGERGKFFRQGAELAQPVYLSQDVQTALTQFARAKGMDLSLLVNELLKKDIELIKVAS